VRSVVFTGFLAGLLAALGLISGCQRPDEANLIILHTGRLMGNAYPLSARKAAPLQYYPFLAGYVKKVRAEAAAHGQQVVLLDSGDSLCGSYAAHVTHSENMVTLFKALNYDAIFLGNLDAVVAPELIARLQPIPVLSPFVEVDQKNPILPGTTISHRLRKGNWDIDLVANFYGNTNAEEFPERFPAYYGRDPLRQVLPFRDYAALLTNRPEPRPSLTLFNWFKFEPATVPPSWLQALAPSQIDVITAHRIYPSNVKETWGAGSYPDWPVIVSENILRQNRGFSVARLDVRISPGQRPHLVRQELVQLTANTADPDQNIVGQLETFAPALTQADLTVGEIKQSYSKDEILMFYLNGLASVPGVNTVVYSPESIRGEWSPGILSASQVYESLPWDLPLISLELTSEQWQKLSSLKRLCVLEKKGAVTGSRRVATSLFFATLLRRELNLPPESLKLIPGASEFDFFVAYLAKNSLSAKPSIPEGWSYRPAL
jgi:hypothetical protein